MTATPDTAPARPSFADTLAVYLKPRVLIVLFLGFSAGLPLALSGSTLLVWMREAGVDLGTIGLFALVGTPYTIKFLWAPIVDALDVPVLSAPARPPARLAGVFAAPADRGDRFPGLLRSRRVAVAGRARRAARRHRVRHAGHRDRRLPHRKPARERAGRRHGLLCRGLPHRHAGLDRRRAVPGQRLRRPRLRQGRRLDGGLSRHGGARGHRHRNRAGGDRAGEVRSRRDRARRADAAKSARARRGRRLRRLRRIPHPRHGASSLSPSWCSTSSATRSPAP